MTPRLRSLRRLWLARVLSRYFGRKTAMAANVFIGLLCLSALFADLLAAEQPIACRLDGRLYVLPVYFHPSALLAFDNQSLSRRIAADGGWALLPPVPFGPDQVKVDGDIHFLSPPDGDHLLGTDASGRDVLARIIHGTRSALMVGMGSMLLCIVLGLLLGALATWSGGVFDRLSNLGIETLTAFPTLFLILGVQGLLGVSTLWQLTVVIGATCWTDVARITRAEVLRAMNEDYVTAARSLGLSNLRILVRHVLPGTLGPAMVSATFGVAGAILIESTLSFLGYGAPPPVASWGQLLSDAFASQDCWWLVVFPGLALSFTVLSINIAGEALSDSVEAL